MIHLRTGLPGAGKTLLTLQEVRERAEKESRAVYYHGIEILKPEMFPGWQLLDDPEKWPDLPDGAIFLHDECQTTYRPRGMGSKVPRHVSEMETHRHKGLDLYLVTQHPMLVDSNVRRLAGCHVHYVRAFGSQLATGHRWVQVKEQCDKSRSDSMRETRPYPSGLFDAYKSATVHTHKRKLPWRVWMLFAAPLMLIGLVVGLVYWYKSNMSEGAKLHQEPTPQATTYQVSTDQAPVGKHLTTMQYLEARTPRIEGLAHTAPLYDEVTKPTRAPYPAACVQWTGKGCRCFTDQGTRLQTPAEICEQIVANGYFVEWDQDKTRRERREPTDLAQAQEGPQDNIRPGSKLIEWTGRPGG